MNTDTDLGFAGIILIRDTDFDFSKGKEDWEGSVAADEQAKQGAKKIEPPQQMMSEYVPRRHSKPKLLYQCRKTDEMKYGALKSAKPYRKMD